MIINPKFTTEAVRERLRLLKKSWRNCPNKNIKYREFRNGLLMELSTIPNTRQMLINMVDDVQMQRSRRMMAEYNRSRLNKQN